MIFEGDDAVRVAMMVTHLQYNAYPPLPASLAPVALEAVDIASSYSYQYDPAFKMPELTLPDGLTVNGKTALTVDEIIDWLHLWGEVTDPLGFEDESQES